MPDKKKKKTGKLVSPATGKARAAIKSEKARAKRFESGRKLRETARSVGRGVSSGSKNRPSQRRLGAGATTTGRTRAPLEQTRAELERRRKVRQEQRMKQKPSGRKVKINLKPTPKAKRGPVTSLFRKVLKPKRKK